MQLNMSDKRIQISNVRYTRTGYYTRSFQLQLRMYKGVENTKVAKLHSQYKINYVNMDVQLHYMS